MIARELLAAPASDDPERAPWPLAAGAILALALAAWGAVAAFLFLLA